MPKGLFVLAEILGQQPHVFLESVLKQGKILLIRMHLSLFCRTAYLFTLQVSVSSSEYTQDGLKQVRCIQLKYLNRITTSLFGLKGHLA